MKNLGTLGVNDKILVHLYRYDMFKNSVHAPNAITQQGISESLAISQPQVARTLKGLLDKKMIFDKKCIVKERSRSLKCYFLLPKGKRRAKTINATFNITEAFSPKDALNMFSMGLQALRNLDKSDAYDRIELDLIIKLQELYYELGEWGHSLELCDKIIELSKQLGEEKKLAYSYYRIGLIFYHKQEYGKANENYITSIELAEKHQGFETM